MTISMDKTMREMMMMVCVCVCVRERERDREGEFQQQPLLIACPRQHKTKRDTIFLKA